MPPARIVHSRNLSVPGRILLPSKLDVEDSRADAMGSLEKACIIFDCFTMHWTDSIVDYNATRKDNDELAKPR